MVTIKVSESIKEGKEEIPMEEIEKLCKEHAKKEELKDEQLPELVKANNTILEYLFLIYPDMSKSGIIDMFVAAKSFVNEKTGLTGVELAKATSLTMIELLDYTRSLIDMNKEMEED